MKALLPAALLARSALASSESRALFAGLAAHSSLPLTDLGTSAVALVLAAAGHREGMAHTHGRFPLYRAGLSILFSLTRR